MDVRSMTVDDVAAVAAVVRAANDDADRRAGREPQRRTDEGRARFRTGMRRFVERDPDGAFVAQAEDGRVVGMAEAIRRGDFWGLSMLFVDPEAQSRGVGRALMQAALRYADGAQVKMIMSSADPRALRRYSGAGLAIHPAVAAAGQLERAAIPPELPGRTGSVDDLDLVAEVDAGLRGSRAEDVQFLLSVGAVLEVVDGPAGRRGYAVHQGRQVAMLGASDATTAAQVLWRAFAGLDDPSGCVQVWGLTSAQDWAVRVALAARLTVSSAHAGAMFLAGRPALPGPWVPSGWYF